MQPSRLPGGRTSIRASEVRAQRLREILAANVDQLVTTADIARLPALRWWTREAIDTAICDLAHDGFLREDGHGRLLIGARP